MNIFILTAILSAFCLQPSQAQPRGEYPRPQFERADWQCLNGDWTYEFDFVGSGMEKQLHQSKGFGNTITVP